MIRNGPIITAEDYRQKLLPLRAQSELRDAWLRHRLDSILPALMRREGISMWIVTGREYNDDPALQSLLPEPSMSPRRRNILVINMKDDGSLEFLAVSRYGFEGYYELAWDPAKETQYACLGRVVRERDPKVIGMDFSTSFAFGDGLTHQDYLSIAAAIGEKYTARIKSAERLAVGWLEVRSEPELIVYPGIVEIGHAIISEAFSSRVIHPGITTNEDVIWWMRQKMHGMGLQAWFHPSIDIVGTGSTTLPAGISTTTPRKVILPGDMLHCDMGFYYLGLATDQQELAYVLKPGETDVPGGLKAGLAEGNRLQDIHLEAMQAGKTGNQILHDALEKARQEGLNPTIYSHPIGVHGHGAGPIIGLWDFQDGVPGNGDYELFANTCYAIELNIKKTVPEWGNQEIAFALEQDAVYTANGSRWLHGRQTEFHLIG